MHTKRLGATALILAFCLSCASAATISLNPVALVKALHANTPVSTRLLYVTNAIAFAGNGGDWYLTHRYAGPGGGGCEQNKFLTTSPCVLNGARFDALKFGVAIGLGIELLPHIVPRWRTWEHLDEWDKIGTMINIPLDAIYTALTFSNLNAAREIDARRK